MRNIDFEECSNDYSLNWHQFTIFEELFMSQVVHWGAFEFQIEGDEALTEDELILSLCREAKEEGSETDLIKRFREKYRDQSELILRACQGDSKALRRLKWVCGLRVVTTLGVWEAKKE